MFFQFFVLGIMEEIVEFPGILYAENVAEQDIL
jgi:hypothetical protein